MIAVREALLSLDWVCACHCFASPRLSWSVSDSLLGSVPSERPVYGTVCLPVSALNALLGEDMTALHLRSTI